MIPLVGDNWSGNLHIKQINNSLSTSTKGKAKGRFNGHSWYFQSNANSWMLEIAEDQTIEPADLPLVGYGCGGWLYEEQLNSAIANEVELTDFIKQQLPFVFNLFTANKLTYLAAVSCPCSD